MSDNVEMRYLRDWQKLVKVDGGDTGRTVYSDERVFWAVYRESDGRHFYVEFDELDRAQTNTTKAVQRRGVLVNRRPVMAWVSDEPLAFADLPQ